MANTSFLPEDYLERKVQRRTNIISLSLFLVVLATMVAAFYVTDQQGRDISRLRKEVDSQFVNAAQRLEQLEQLKQQKQAMIRKANVTASLLERVPRSMLLAELINNMPATLSLLEFHLDTTVLRGKRAPAKTALEKAKAKLASEKKAVGEVNISLPATEVKLNLVGVAPTDVQVAAFMASLGESAMFNEIRLVYTEEVTVEDRVMRKFRVDLKLASDMNLQDVNPKKIRRLTQNPMGDLLQIGPDGKMQPAG